MLREIWIYWNERWFGPYTSPAHARIDGFIIED